MENFSQSVIKTKILLFGLCSYFVIAWANHFFNLMILGHPLDIYFAFSFLLCFLFTSVSLKKERVNLLFDRYDFILGCFLSVIYFITRYIKFEDRGVWLDEYTQYSYGNQMIKYSSIGQAINEQQPPLDYILSGFSGTILGHSAFAVKFHALLFALLFLLLLPKAISFFSQSYWVRWLPSFIIMLSNPLLAYSLEGRPLMIALFFALIFIIFTLNYAITKKDFLWLVLAEFLFLNTTGLQPQLMILFFLCLIALEVMVFEKDKKKAIKLFSSGVLSCLLHLPILYFLTLYTEKTNQFNPDFLQNFIDTIKFNSLRRVGEIYAQDIYLIKFIGIFLFLGMVYALIKKRWRDLNLLIFPFVFLFGYFIIYKTFISWNFGIRYTYCLFAPFGLALGISFSYIDRVKSKKLIFSALLIFIAWAGYKNTISSFEDSIKNIGRPGWASMFSDLNGVMKPGDHLLRVSFVDYGDWRGNAYVADFIYGNEVVQDSIIRHYWRKEWDHSNQFFFDEKVDYLKPTTESKLYIMTLPYSFYERYRDLNTAIVAEKKSYFLIDLYRIPIKKNLYETTKEFFLQLIERYPMLEASIPFYESLLELELKYGKTDELFHRLLTDYNDIRLSRRRSMDGLYYNKEETQKKRFIYYSRKMRERWK